MPPIHVDPSVTMVDLNTALTAFFANTAVTAAVVGIVCLGIIGAVFSALRRMIGGR